MCVILFTPVMLLTLIATAVTLSFVKLTKSQIATKKALMFDAWYKAPGKKLAVKPSAKDTSDILISEDFVDKNGYMHACGGLGYSLRKSLEHTVNSHLREGSFGAKVSTDNEPDRPRCLLNGSTYPYDPKYDELWCSSAKVGCHWPSIYSWTPNLPEGLSFPSLTQKIRVEDLPEVLGYVYYFEVSNSTFYDADRIVKVGQGAVNCPRITPENEGKVFVRYNYTEAYNFGDITRADADAYIFKGKTIQDAGIELKHTYRVMRPTIAGMSGSSTA